MKKERNVKPTKRQKRAVNALISGEAKSVKGAMLDAGYSKWTAGKGTDRLIRTKGVAVYLRELDKESRKLFAMSLPAKVMNVYLEGLSAERPYGKNAILFPDHLTRKAFADTFARFYGWLGERLPAGGKYTQFNFFSVGEKERGEFNRNFKGFLKYFYERQKQI